MPSPKKLKSGSEEGWARAEDLSLGRAKEAFVAMRSSVNTLQEMNLRLAEEADALAQHQVARTLRLFILFNSLGVALGLLLMWRQPAPGEAELPVTDKIDLAPSSVVRVWGLAIVIAVGVLYWLFF